MSIRGYLVSKPSEFILEFYSIYSTITLILCWVLVPPLLYIIFTQSSKLKDFKWMVLNHLFWCLALETLIGIIKPVMLAPAFAGYQIGPFRYIFGNHATGITGGICFAMASSCSIGLSATLTCRYLLIFPSKMKDWFTVKKFLFLAVILPFAFYFMVAIIAGTSGQDPIEQNFAMAKEYDPILADYFYVEPTFCFLPPSYHNVASLCTIIFLLIVMTGGIGVIIFFRFQVSKHKTISSTALKKSLILSSIIQIVLTCIFLFLPIVCFLIFARFDIPHSANFMCFLMCVFATHSLVEFIATLYFVHPYRIFIIKFINEKVLRRKLKVKIVRIISFHTSLNNIDNSQVFSAINKSVLNK